MFGAKEKCHKCGKTVYAVEKLNILDKTWHKWCFKCATCDMTLTMKNYSATGGVPYCKAHYPAPGSSEDQVKTGEGKLSCKFFFVFSVNFLRFLCIDFG
tara:strand:- start:584 stop:880 length:297 start_codon:yes stop_codon:yes gene_type:complete